MRQSIALVKYNKAISQGKTLAEIQSAWFTLVDESAHSGRDFRSIFRCLKKSIKAF